MPCYDTNSYNNFSKETLWREFVNKELQIICKLSNKIVVSVHDEELENPTQNAVISTEFKISEVF